VDTALHDLWTLSPFHNQVSPLEASESRYRRLFETAQDAILILEEDSGKIMDANPFLIELLGYSLDELIGKELWEIALFRDKQQSKAAMQQSATLSCPVCLRA